MDGDLRRLSDGEMVFDEGDPGRVMYVIESGKVEIFRTKHGKEVKLATLGSGEYFGEMSLLLDAPRSASARTVGETALKVIDKAAFEGMSVKHPIVWDLLTALSQRVSDVDAKLTSHEAQNEMRKDAVGSFLEARRQFF